MKILNSPGADDELLDSLGVLSLDSEIYQVEVWRGCSESIKTYVSVPANSSRLQELPKAM